MKHYHSFVAHATHWMQICGKKGGKDGLSETKDNLNWYDSHELFECVVLEVREK